MRLPLCSTTPIRRARSRARVRVVEVRECRGRRSSIAPASGAAARRSARVSVDLPLPDTPTRLVVWRRGRARGEAPRRTRVSSAAGALGHALTAYERRAGRSRPAPSRGSAQWLRARRGGPEDVRPRSRRGGRASAPRALSSASPCRELGEVDELLRLLLAARGLSARSGCRRRRARSTCSPTRPLLDDEHVLVAPERHAGPDAGLDDLARLAGRRRGRAPGRTARCRPWASAGIRSPPLPPLTPSSQPSLALTNRPPS